MCSEEPKRPPDLLSDEDAERFVADETLIAQLVTKAVG